MTDYKIMGRVRVHQALRELNELKNVNVEEYTDAELEYRGELLADLFLEFQQAGLTPKLDLHTGRYNLL